MKKRLNILIIVISLLFSGAYATQGFGGYVGLGYDGIVGGQVYFDNLRFSIGVDLYAGAEIIGSIDYLSYLYLSKQNVNPYYGIGVGASYIFPRYKPGKPAYILRTQGIGGIVFDVSSRSKIVLFLEAGISPEIFMMSGYSPVYTFAFNVKLGMKFN